MGAYTHNEYKVLAIDPGLRRGDGCGLRVRETNFTPACGHPSREREGRGGGPGLPRRLRLLARMGVGNGIIMLNKIRKKI